MTLLSVTFWTQVTDLVSLLVLFENRPGAMSIRVTGLHLTWPMKPESKEPSWQLFLKEKMKAAHRKTGQQKGQLHKQALTRN